MRFRSVAVTAGSGSGQEKALALFRSALKARGIPPDGEECLPMTFEADASLEKEEFAAAQRGGEIVLSASSLRGFVYAFSRFLRKIERRGDAWTVCGELFGRFAPRMRIRGHQLGYRPKNNTYDAWDVPEFAAYYLDMMAFGSNTVELMPGGTDDGERNEIMKRDENEMLFLCAEAADEVDLDVSVWYPNCEESTPQESAELRGRIFSQMKRLNYVFPPGGDPGSYDAPEFLERAVLAAAKLAESHPEAQMWPSAQKPHGRPAWGDEFIDCLEQDPPGIAGIIAGPNEAMDIDTLRRRLPAKYPLRYYPDICHNVRCTFPVHFPRDDWHFALAATLGRESVNPRPTEYRSIFAAVAPYCVGSVSYSEGCSDDVNKMVWAALDWDPDADLNEVLCDYARFFLPGADPQTAADGIFALEHNWIGDPAENPGIDATLALWQGLADACPALMGNWRFVSLLFRAECDEAVRMRRRFELGLVKRARELMAGARRAEALAVLRTDYPESYKALRADLNKKAEMLYNTIGLQLNIKDFHASAAERGATLETIDKPVTDRAYLERALAAMTEDGEAAVLEAHMRPGSGEAFFSVALDTCDRFGGKPPEAYLNFKGNGELNDGRLPMALIGVYNYYSFTAPFAGLESGCDYLLRITLPRPRRRIPYDMWVKADGKEIWRGDLFERLGDAAWDGRWLPEEYCSVTFRIPAEQIVNGCTRISFGEDRVGVEFSELRLTPIR